MNLFKRFVIDEEGANATEYALVIGLIALAIVVAVSSVGTSLSNAFTNIKTSIDNNVK